MDPIERNKALVRHWLDLVSRHEIERICALPAPTWTMTGGPPHLPAGPDGIRALFATFGKVSQLWEIDDVIGEGNRVAMRATNTVIQERFFGIDARGYEQRFTATFIFRLADGLIQETWRSADDLGRLLQLGARLVPGPAADQPQFEDAPMN
jgi:hypothetical protein